MVACFRRALCAGTLFAILLVCAPKDLKIITAESGQTVALPCQASKSKLVEWTRPDLKPEYVLVYRDGYFTDDQHPSFKNRVDLQDRQMKDGDVSLILKNVTINDTGTYKCDVQTERDSMKLISIITLVVVAPPGQQGGLTKDGGGGKIKSVGLKVGPQFLLYCCCCFFLLLVFLVF